MQTLYLSANEPNTAQTAADIIKHGGLVALPTETVYGLGANGLSPAAVDRIFEAKGRPDDNPLILHICDASQIAGLCHDVPPSAYALAAAFWPGPLTMVLPARETVPKRTTGGLSTVAVRCPDSDVTRAIIRLSGVPIAAPSANLSGKPSTTSAQHVRHDHHGRIDCIVDGGPCRVGVESTIVDLTEAPPRLLRPGGITLEELKSVLGEVVVDKAITQSLSQNEVAKAPGMKYKHYAPACEVVIVSGDSRRAAGWVNAHWQPGDRVLCFEEELPLYGSCAPLSYGKEADPATLSAGLFDALRTLDDPSIGTVYARCPEDNGIGMAVRNRLSKAAAFRIIHPELEKPMSLPASSQTGVAVRNPALENGSPRGFAPRDDRDPSEAGCHREPVRTLAWRSVPYVLGITGGTGCGKTTLLNAVRDLGGRVIDCDAVYHHLLLQDKALVCAIEERFPGTVEAGVLDRKKLGAVVFTDKEALQDLNAITHTAVKREVEGLLAESPGFAAIDAIALFESGLAHLCNTTVAVTAPPETRVKRLMARDGISEDYARARIAAQPDNGYFSNLCRHTLKNNGTESQFRQKCLAFLQDLGIMRA